MTIEQRRVIDIVAIGAEDEDVLLVISDHLQWDDENEHLFLLQEKINSYLAYLESGEIFEAYPTAKGRCICIRLVVKYRPNKFALHFLGHASEIIENAGFKFAWELLDG